MLIPGKAISEPAYFLSCMDPKPIYDAHYVIARADPPLVAWQEYARNVRRRLKIAAVFAPRLIVQDSFLYTATAMHLFADTGNESILGLCRSHSRNETPPITFAFRSTVKSLGDLHQLLRPKVVARTFEPFEGFTAGETLLNSSEFLDGYVANLSNTLAIGMVNTITTTDATSSFESLVARRDQQSLFGVPEGAMRATIDWVEARRRELAVPPSRTLYYEATDSLFVQRANPETALLVRRFVTHQYYHAMAEATGATGVMESCETSPWGYSSLEATLGLDQKQKLDDVATDLVSPDFYDALPIEVIMKDIRNWPEFRTYVAALQQVHSEGGLSREGSQILKCAFSDYRDLLSENAHRYWTRPTLPDGRGSMAVQAQFRRDIRAKAFFSAAALGVLAYFDQSVAAMGALPAIRFTLGFTKYFRSPSIEPLLPAFVRRIKDTNELLEEEQARARRAVRRAGPSSDDQIGWPRKSVRRGETEAQ